MYQGIFRRIYMYLKLYVLTVRYDHSICFNCGRGLKDRLQTDDPWIEYVVRFPFSAFT